MRHHCIITGTGRAGTTYLVQLLTRLGIDTGFSVEAPVDDVAHAGLEFDLRNPDAPYVVKSPWICTYIHELPGDVIINSAIIPMRVLADAAESRRRVQRVGNTDQPVPGGLWEVLDPQAQEDELARKFFHLVQQLTAIDTRIVFVDFPRIVHDPDYLYTHLASATGLALPNRAAFQVAFRATARPDLVHHFQVR